jgi:Ca2+-binding EF-hand superfamily protein
MVKGSFQDRSRLLFKFYDLDCTGGVSYNELLKMVYFFTNQALQLS